MKSGTAHAPVVIDTAGPALDAADRRRLRHRRVGGLILFARHCVDRRQIVELCAEAKSVRPDLLITIDQEGGRVQRMRSDGFTPLPPMRALGERWMRDAMAATDAASAVGYVLGAELRACGIDLSFAPVLDLDHGTSAVIGDRAFHRDPRVVALLAKSVMHGLLKAGMAHCGKHFPGHGYVAADSHVALPVDRRTLNDILADDARPYAWLATTLAAVMPAHVVYPRVDALPAGFSERWLGDVLRRRLGFTGAIVSDDLSMRAARDATTARGDADAGGDAAAAMLALAAGCDLVLLCNQSLVDRGAPIDALLAGLDEAAATGRWQPDADGERRRLALLPQTPPLTWDALMHDAAYLQALDRLA